MVIAKCNDKAQIILQPIKFKALTLEMFFGAPEHLRSMNFYTKSFFNVYNVFSLKFTCIWSSAMSWLLNEEFLSRGKQSWIGLKYVSFGWSHHWKYIISLKAVKRERECSSLMFGIFSIKIRLIQKNITTVLTSKVHSRVIHWRVFPRPWK